MTSRLSQNLKSCSFLCLWANSAFVCIFLSDPLFNCFQPCSTSNLANLSEFLYAARWSKVQPDPSITLVISMFGAYYRYTCSSSQFIEFPTSPQRYLSSSDSEDPQDPAIIMAIFTPDDRVDSLILRILSLCSFQDLVTMTTSSPTSL
ncbi:hypothetical protein FGO68_gene17697 [Halteria grandinella]|uniref:Uncharacterized protein n=1 Tax=Halteria grandinella TaxID=5974 RepID=A0A8J8P141_HALGN|nr:hypothetical protein FGO68_gene17697 [Halteria grandinella]